MTLAILFSLKTVKSLQIGVATHFQGTPLFSMRTVLLVSLQSCRSVDANAWCKRDLKCNQIQTHSNHRDHCYSQDITPVLSLHSQVAPPELKLTTVRERSCRKVMFLHLSVILFTHPSGKHTHPPSHTPLADTPPGYPPPPGQTPARQTHTPSPRRPLQQTVRILL